MTSVTVVARFALIVLLLLVDSGQPITVSSVKKAVPNGGTDRDQQSLTFSSNGEDQLIFSDAAFPVREGSPRVNPTLRRAGDEKSTVVEFFESGWRPLYNVYAEDSDDKVSDQLPQEALQQPVVAESPPLNRTTKFYRFSVSDIMHAQASEPVGHRTGKSPDAIQFQESPSEEPSSIESVQETRNEVEDKDPRNLTDAALQMLRFEESDRMNFEGKSKGLKFTEDNSLNSQPNSGENSVQPANYEVYVIENLLMNLTGPSRHASSGTSLQKNSTFKDTHPRILKSAGDIHAIQEATHDVPRNSSRFFRFEEPQKTGERTRFEKSPVSTLKFHESTPTRDSFKFPRPEEPNRNQAPNRNQEPHYQSGGTFKFRETDSRPHSHSSSLTRFEDVGSKPFKFANEATGVTRPQNDQYYTVKATIQIDGWDNPAITPPTIPATTRRPKMKKGKIYNQQGVDIRKQDGFNYQQPTDYDNYLQQAAANAVHQYQSNFQIPPTPQIPIPQNPPNNNPYYQTHSSPGTPNPPYDPNTYYIQSYLANYPVQQPIQSHPVQPLAEGSSNYPQQQHVPSNHIPGSQSDSPLSAQSIFGFLQSIFNFAPGTFGSYPTTLNTGTKAGDQGQSDSGTVSPIMVVSTQLRKALDNISDNDELQCVPKLICMMSRRTTGQGFSTYVNRGLLSTILSAVPDSSPWLKFSRAALLGYGIGANSCDVYYPRCPKDESEIIFYLNNHRGGFFRFFNDGQNDLSRG